MGIGEHFDGVKQHWAHNFAFLDYFKKVYGRAEPLPKWSDTDVEEFIASDPVYGPQLKALRESRKFALGGALVGATHLGGVAFKYSKAPHGVLLATGFGAITGAVLGAEVAEHWYQLYKVDKQGANLRFIYWWEDKVSDVDRTMKKYSDNLLHALDGVSSRLSQMESRTHQLENSIDELKLTIGNYNGSTDGKLRHLENMLRVKNTLSPPPFAPRAVFPSPPLRTSTLAINKR